MGNTVMDKNNFDGVRIGLALIVVFAHISALTQLGDFTHFESIFDANFAVKGFFAISGFLVSKSYLSSHHLTEYGEKRLRRIYPAYASAIILCLCIGLLTTTLSLSDFIKSPETLKYIIANLAFLNFLKPTLPGVFENNPLHALNGSLWTIKVEVMLYFCIPTIIYLTRKTGPNTTFFFVFIISIAWIYYFNIIYTGPKGEEIGRQFPGQLSYFASGVFCATNNTIEKYLKYISISSIILLFAIKNAYLKLIIDPIAYSSIVIYLSLHAFENLKFGRYGDISYGIYLYHFPIIQFLISSGVFQHNSWLGLTATFALTFAAALASWHLIEKPMLKRTSHYRVVAGA